MNIQAKESIITLNNDGTYRIEFPNIDFTDADGKLINGTIIFPRTKTDLIKEENGTYKITPLCNPIDLETVGDTIFTIEVQE